MLQALKEFGEFFGRKEGFESELGKVRDGDKIAILSIDEDGVMNIEEEIEYEKDNKYDYLFYYTSGNPSVTGTTGIGGISPFFLKLSTPDKDKKEKNGIKIRLTPDKIEKSKQYEELYKKISYLFRFSEIAINKEQQESLLKHLQSIGQTGLSKSIKNAQYSHGNEQIRIIKDENAIATLEIIGDSCYLKRNDQKNDKKIEIGKVIHEDDKLNIYRISDDSLIKDLLDYLKKQANLENVISSAKNSPKKDYWIYICKFKGKNTTDIHEQFIKLYIKESKRNKNVDDITGKCSLCGKVSCLRYPNLPFFALDVSNYNHGLSSNNQEGSRLKICINCGSYVSAGWRALRNLFGNNYYALIPKLRENSSDNNKDLEEFTKIINNNHSDFEKLNNLLRKKVMNKRILFSFLVMKGAQQKILIEKFVPNYKTFAINFEDESLMHDDELEYVDFRSKNIKIEIPNIIPKINSFFKLEKLLEFFFVYGKNQSIYQYISGKFHIYNLYNNNLPKNMDPSFKHLLYLHRDELFSFIYETNITALKRETLNTICLNFLLYEIRKKRVFWKNKSDQKIGFRIMEALNYYYFLKNKILEDIKMKEQINELKLAFKGLESEATKENSIKSIDELVNQKGNEHLLYYLIGQLIKKIDGYRYEKNKNKTFDSFVQSINRKNIKQRFAEDILQKQNYYIQKLNPKAKHIFNLMATNLNTLFDYEPYEEMLISIITGYYSSDILKSEKSGGNGNGN